MKATLAVAILSSTLVAAQQGAGGGVAYKKMSKLRGDPIVQNMQKVKKAAVEKNKMTEEQTFDFEGLSLSMTAGEVDKDFCASASPVSLAGYMNGKFLFLP